MTAPAETTPRTPTSAPSDPTPKGRGRKPGIPAKERADIPADEMQLYVLPERAKADLRRKREERKPQQKAVDTIVYDLFEINDAHGFGNGSIKNWPDLAVYDWPITKTHYETAIFLIGKAARFYNRAIIWGEQVEVPANKNHLVPNPEDPEMEIPCHLNGKLHIHVPFSAVRKQDRNRD